MPVIEHVYSRLRKWQKMFPSIRTLSFFNAKINKTTFSYWRSFKHFENRILFTFHGSTDVKPILCDEKQHAHITYCLLELLVFVELSAAIFTSFQKTWKDCFSRSCRLIKTSDDRRESPHACAVRQPLTSSRSRCQILNSLFLHKKLIVF